jgi:hypothetical protein
MGFLSQRKHTFDITDGPKNRHSRPRVRESRAYRDSIGWNFKEIVVLKPNFGVPCQKSGILRYQLPDAVKHPPKFPFLVTGKKNPK